MLMATTDTGTPAAATDTPWYASALTALTSAYQQNQLYKINLERAKQGLPPLDSSAMATTVNVGLPPAQMQQIMLLGGAALLAVILLAMRKK